MTTASPDSTAARDSRIVVTTDGRIHPPYCPQAASNSPQYPPPSISIDLQRVAKRSSSDRQFQLQVDTAPTLREPVLLPRRAPPSKVEVTRSNRFGGAKFLTVRSGHMGYGFGVHPSLRKGIFQHFSPLQDPEIAPAVAADAPVSIGFRRHKSRHRAFAPRSRYGRTCLMASELTT